MNKLDKYLELQKEVFEYFGYKEDWRVLPIEDSREYYWYLEGEAHGDSVRFADDADDLINDADEYYSNEIYTNRHLPKWVYRGKDYTMICVDTRTDGNQFLQIFSNILEVKL